jgi:hypothetical protein
VKDPGNSSLRQQEKKIGHTPNVCTSDMIPIREASSNPAWDTIFGASKWVAIKKLCLDFNYAILKLSPVVVLVGKASFEAFEKKLLDDKSIRPVKVKLGISTKVFSKDAFFYVVKDRTNDQIRQLVFLSVHGSRFLLGSELNEGVYTDLIWNAAATISCIDILSPAHFSFMSAKTNKDIERQRKGCQKGHETQAAGNWESLERGRQTLAAGGHKHLIESNRRRQEQATAIRVAKLHALLRSFDVQYLLRHEASYYKDWAKALYRFPSGRITHTEPRGNPAPTHVSCST